MFALLLAGLLAMPQEMHAIEVHERLLILQDGSTLRYTIAVPESYNAEQAVPLILALHYGREEHESKVYFGQGVLTRLVEPALAELNAIVIAPDCPENDWTDPKIVAATLALLDYTVERYNIDRNRIVVTGYSMGGHGTWHFAAHHPDRFSAAIPIAGWPPLDLVEEFPDIPLYVIHSRDDEAVPIKPTETMMSRLKERGMPVEFMVVEGVSHHQTIQFRPYLKATIPWLKKIWGD